MAGISQPNVYPDQFSGGEGRSIYRSPLMRGRGPAPSGIGQGLENIAAALMPPNPATQALAEDRMAQAELRKQQLAAGVAKLADAKRQQEFDSDPVANIATRLAGPEAAAYMKAGGQQAPPVPLDDEGNAFPKIPMERPARLSPAMEQNVISAALTHLANKTNMEQAAKAQQEQQTTSYRGAIAGDPTPGMDPSKVAAGFYATSGKAPFTQGKMGETFSPLTGKDDVSGVIPQANIGEIGARTGKEKAQAGQASAAAGASSAHAGLFRAQTDQVKEGGGKGSATYQDAATGKRYAYKQGDPQAYLMNDDGTTTPIPATSMPASVTKIGSPGAAGARENVMLGRVGQAGGQVTASLENIARLPLTANTGLFGGRKQGPGLLDATREVLANEGTGQEAQSYNVKAAGIQRNLAAIEASGLMPPGTLSHQMDAVIWKAGDTNLTKLQKLAETRQIVDAGLGHILENPRVSDQEKAKLKDYQARMSRAVPFTHQDLDDWQAATETNPAITLNQFLSTRTRAPAAAAPKAGGGVKFLGFE